MSNITTSTTVTSALPVEEIIPDMEEDDQETPGI